MSDTTDDMKIKAIAPWFGGKRSMAGRIVQELGRHTAYWEPFCGGLSILSAKEKSRQECVNDLHGDLINLARVVQDDELAPRLFDRLLRTLPHEDELALARERSVRSPELPADHPPDLERAVSFYVLSWLGRNGHGGLKKTERTERLCVRWRANGGDPATRFRNAIASMPAWWDRLRGVTILRRDGFEILEKIADEPGVVIYCDPPYLVKSDCYVHDFESAPSSMFGDDHTRLAETLRRFKRARVVVSYYQHPRIDELYRGWAKVQIEVAKNTSHTSGAVTRATELLIINGPSYTQQADTEVA